MSVRRIGSFAFLVLLLAGGRCEDVLAKASKGPLHHLRGSFSHVRATTANDPPVPPMRYHGGPKSPMWPGPAAN